MPAPGHELIKQGRAIDTYAAERQPFFRAHPHLVALIISAVNVRIYDRKDRFMQQWQGVKNAARSLQRLGFRGKADPDIPSAAISHGLLDLCTEMRVVDDHRAKSRGC